LLFEPINAKTELVNKPVDFGFNEWLKAQDGKPKGQDWQTWSAALYLYAAKCVELKSTPFFDEMRVLPVNKEDEGTTSHE
jgi:hypothetical protein